MRKKNQWGVTYLEAEIRKCDYSETLIFQTQDRVYFFTSTEQC